jgi:hypothetical protein
MLKSGMIAFRIGPKGTKARKEIRPQHETNGSDIRDTGD